MRGFTLIEILVVLLLAALMLALVPPLFSSSVSRAGMSALAEKVAASLRRTRSQAVFRGESVPWHLDIEQGIFQIGDAGRKQQLNKDVSITLTTARSEMQGEAIAAIRFYPDGGSTGGEITLQQDKRRKTISVDWITGRIGVE